MGLFVGGYGYLQSWYDLARNDKLMIAPLLGAAYLTGLQSGVVSSVKVIDELWQRDRLFEPAMDADRRDTVLREGDLVLQKLHAGEVV